MDEGVVRMQAQMYALVADMNAIIADIKGMEAANTERESHGYTLAYPESVFVNASKDLKDIATGLRLL